MATEDKTEEAFISQPLTLSATVLDLGCTRAMDSRVAAQDLMKFCDDNPNCGIWYTIAETTSQFQFELHLDKALNSSPELGIWDVKLKVAPSSHLALDLLDLSRLMWNVRFDKHKKSSFLTYFSHYEQGFHQKTLGSSSLEGCCCSAGAHVSHPTTRIVSGRTRYEPKEGAVPIPLEYLDNKRKTIIEFSKGKNVGSPEEELSKGRTGASGSSPPGEDPQKRNLARVEQERPEALHRERYRREGEFAQGRGLHGPATKVAAAPLAPEDDPDLQEYQGFGFLNAS
eukprot:s9783_g1.t1